jgi:hypothetical protein
MRKKPMANSYLVTKECCPQDQEQGKDTHCHHVYGMILKAPTSAVRKETEVKGNQIRKEEGKMSLFPGDMIISV